MNIVRFAEHPAIAWVFRKRFVKFGIVGGSGVVVNLGVLYLCQEFLFIAVQPSGTRLNMSLAVAIFCATINNFFWNRNWTWLDRKHHHDKHLLFHFGQYALACWVGILLQVLLTKLFVLFLHYLIANAAAIVLASVFNFLVNNFWTFRSRMPAGEIALPNIPGLEQDIDQEISSK